MGKTSHISVNNCFIICQKNIARVKNYLAFHEPAFVLEKFV